MPHKITYRKDCHCEVIITNTDEECIEALARLNSREHTPAQADSLAVAAAFHLAGLLPFPNGMYGVSIEPISEQETEQWKRVFSGIS